jgi:4-amino-4-deoxy-L-arabinose transferase-like glycosyltransferase
MVAGMDMTSAPATAWSPSRDAVRRLFWFALALRVSVAVLIHLGIGDEELFAPDQRAYHAIGKFLADLWGQDVPVVMSRVLPEGPKGYFYIVASIYYVIGPYSLLPKLLNCLVGAFMVPVAHDLALRMGTSAAAALRAAKLVMWFPSLVLWSALNIRDAWIILLIALLCRQALILQSRFRIGTLLLLVGGLVAVVQFRAYLLFAIGAPILVSFVAQRSRNLPRNLILGSIVAAALIYADQAAGEARKGRFVDFEEIHNIRYWNTVGASSQFEQADISTPGKALAYLPRGLALFLLAPFPWMLGSVRQILAVPETLYFYWLIPWMIRGIRGLLREHLRTSLLAVLITAGLTLGYALGEGNAGTAYRHRAQLLTFFLIFAASGLDARRRSYAAVETGLPRVA